MSVNVVDGMLTFQGEKASGCSGLNTLIVEVPFTTKIAGLVGLIVYFSSPTGVVFLNAGLVFWPKILEKKFKGSGSFPSGKGR